MANTLEISGNLYKKNNGTIELNVSINPSVTFTEYTEQEIKVAASGTESINLGGIAFPTMLYIETDNAVEFQCYRALATVATSLPIESAMLLTGNSGKRFGTVSIKNSGASEAVVHIYAGG